MEGMLAHVPHHPTLSLFLRKHSETEVRARHLPAHLSVLAVAPAFAETRMDTLAERIANQLSDLVPIVTAG